ncbi:pyranose 2-oxidase [Mycena leptocephala]|nr:pyranose 2-oxidase [Mycena leptocephala]
MSANTTIPKSQITFSAEKPTFDRPIGATYAKLLVKAGLTVAMVDIGAATSFTTTKGKNDEDIFVPGGHKRNESNTRKIQMPALHMLLMLSPQRSTVSRLMRKPEVELKACRAALSTVSIPVDNVRIPNEPPDAWSKNVHPHIPTDKPFVSNGMNPNQNAYLNLDAAAVTRVVGGDNKLWDALYTEAEGIIGMSTTQFKNSIRGLLIQATLSAAFPSRTFADLPVACHRLKNDRYLEWHAAATILKDIYENADQRKNFKLLTNHQCIKLETDETDYKIEKARILFNSGFSGDSINAQSTSQIPNLGLFLTEQPVTFCQTIWKKSLLDSIKKAEPKKPTGGRRQDPAPQIYYKPRKSVRGMIQRDDAWSFGAFGDTVDNRLIVDFRFFGMATPLRKNRVTFTHEYRDAYGMPQPTFEFDLKDTDRENSNEMLADMCAVASRIGGFLPGAEPQFQKPGTALHIAGTTRAGLTSGDSVVDTDCKVWKFDNLYLGGNGVISTAFAGNPTLTSIAYAIKSAKSIITKLQTKPDPGHKPPGKPPE